MSAASRAGRRRACAAAAVVLFLLGNTGCSTIKLQSPSWNKPVGKGTIIPALICGAIGAGIGIAIQNERPGESRIEVDGMVFKDEDPKDLWKGAVIGAPIGMAVCGLLGHIFLDPTPEITLPPVPPIPTPTPVPVKQRIVLRGVNFDFDSSELRPDAQPVLDHSAEILAGQSDIDVVVSGHTDAVGSEAYNEALSVRRAEAVYRYLINRGIAPERMRVEGFGERSPVADNATAAGRAQNRRVELQVSP